MATNYKLTYFNLTALGEPIRFLFNYGAIPFEDNRIERADWPKLKPSTPYGQMPLLEYKGKVAHQSLAIARYVAKQVNLVGKDEWEDLEIDAVVDTVSDMRLRMSACFHIADEKVKEAKNEVFYKETLPFILERLDAQAAKNNGYLAVGRLTWADLFLVGILDYVNMMATTDILAKYPNLVKVRSNVLALPSIKSWIAKRPKGEC